MDTSGAFQSSSVIEATETSLDALFAAEATATFQQPWLKLDRGAKWDRLRRFVEAYPGLTGEERDSLRAATRLAHEAGQLKAKAAVDYDANNGEVLTIHGLRERKTPSGRKFRIEPRPAAKTRKATDPPQA
jgi:hypothetical protein